MKKDHIVVAIILTMTLTAPAHAYIDPGSGSVLTTAIIGFFAAITYTLRKYFYRISDLFRSGGRKERAPELDD